LLEDKCNLFSEKWCLELLELIAETPRGHVYKCHRGDKKVVLKIYTGAGVNEERRGVEFLKVCANYSVVSVLEQDQEAVLLEFCSGPSLESLVEKGEDDQATRVIAEVVAKLHKCPIPDAHPFLSLEKRFETLVRATVNYKNRNEAKHFDKASRIASELCRTQEKSCLLHGDIHHGNILQHSERGWLVIDPKGFVGDPVYDFANTFLNPWEMPQIVRNKGRVLRQSKILEECTGIPQQRIINYAYVQACLSQAWFLEEGETSEHVQEMMNILDPLSN
jgi:streptomycin 6-kinase